MSAFIVSDQTLLNIVTFLDSEVRYPQVSHSHGYLNKILLKEGFNLQQSEHRDRLIKEMALLNRQGVNARYGEDEIEMDVRYAERQPPSIIQTYKSLGCFLYQCCEGDIPETSELYKMFKKIHDELAHLIVRSFKDYDTAKWDA